MNKLLIDEYPLILQPTLAVHLGLPEAIFIQQLHYWLQNNKAGYWAEDDNGSRRKWVHNTYEEWHTQMPFWSVTGLRKIIKRCEDKGLILGQAKSANGFDKTKSYTILYEEVARLTQSDSSSDLSSRKDEASKEASFTETTTKTTTNTASADSALPLDWKIAVGQEITQSDLDKERQNKQMDIANLISMGTGVMADVYMKMAMAFQETRGIVLNADESKKNRKAIQHMLDNGATPEHVVTATRQLMNAKTKDGKSLTIVDMMAIKKTVINLAITPEEHGENSYLEGI